jgi:hypothetical protein
VKKNTINKKSWFFEMINKIENPRQIWLNWGGKRPELIKLEKKGGRSEQTSTNSRKSLRNTLKTYIQINWKI